MRERASTIVVIKGLAITAGSNPTFLASMGRVHPTTFAMNMVTTKVKHTTEAMVRLTLSKNISLQKVAAPRVMPQAAATRISFQII